jgi:hypothetical protein
MPIPNQRAREQAQITMLNGDIKMLPAGAYVKRIDKTYISNYCKDQFNDYDPVVFSVIYCQFGIALVRNEYLDMNVY